MSLAVVSAVDYHILLSAYIIPLNNCLNYGIGIIEDVYSFHNLFHKSYPP